MTTLMAKEQDLAVAVDTLAALEQRVVRTIEMLNREREQRGEIEKELASVRSQLDHQQAQGATLQREIEELHRERDTVRTRVERLMSSLDAIEASYTQSA
jgi:septal ring factor EnvC (AmiA/AmiB activator)